VKIETPHPYWITGMGEFRTWYETVQFKDRLWVWPCMKLVYPRRIGNYVVTPRSVDYLREAIGIN
jgi:hypothetical protein